MAVAPVRAALLAALAVVVGAASDLPGGQDAPVSAFTPSHAFADYLAGRSAALHGDLELATEKLTAALAVDPAETELAARAFLAATLAGDPDAIRLAGGLGGRSPIAELVLGDRELAIGAWESAISRFAALPHQGVTEVLRPLLLAWAQQGAGHTADALATLAPLTAAGQRLRAVYTLHAALIADLGGATAEAARYYEQAAAEYGPGNLRVSVILASWQARQGRLDEAQRTIRGLASANGDLALVLPVLEAQVAAAAPARIIRSPLDGVAEAYMALAATLQQQNVEGAHVLVRLALDLRPEFTQARLILAEIQERAKQPERALATLAAIPRSDPLAGVVALREAALLDQAGRKEEATQRLSELAREHPDRPEPLVQQGDELRRAKRFPEAAALYSQAIARIATPSRANWPLFYERGIAEEQAGEWKRAEADFLYALELAPDQPNVLNYLAYAWTERNEHLDRARTMLESAVQQRPNDGAILDSLGWLLLRQGSADAALARLERAVELQPEDSVINAHLGDALAAAGRRREAEFQWRRALNLNPEPADATVIEQKLAAPESGPGPQAPAPGAAP